MNVKLNHLLPVNLQRESCGKTTKQHYWVPTCEPEAKLGGNFGLQMRCDRCGSSHYIFLTESDHSIQKGLIQKSLNISRNRLTRE